MADVATLGIVVELKNGQLVARQLDDIEKASGRAEKKATDLERAVRGLAGALAAWKAAETGREILTLAARYETLGIAMNQVGHNAGYTAKQMEAMDVALRKTGISMIESRNNLARMAAAQLDLTKATQLGRVAQDAAVIAGINSSEAFERLVQGIVAGQPRVLHTMGIFADFGHEEEKWAKAHGRSAESLSQVEKVNIRLNNTLEEGAKRAGVYEAALGTAGKQLQSSKRYAEDLKVKLGETFQPEFTAAVFLYSDALKLAGEHAEGLAIALRAVAAVGIGAGLIKLLSGTATGAAISLAATSAATFANASGIAAAATVGFGAKIGGLATTLGPATLLLAAGALAIYDINKAFEDHDDAIEEATKKGKDYLAYLKALGVAHSQSGGAGALVPPTKTDDDAVNKFKALTSERQHEIEKQVALNAAFGQSSAALQILGIRYDAMIAKSKDAKEHAGKELATLNALTDAMAKQSIRAVELADAKEARDRAKALALANLQVEIDNAIARSAVSGPQQSLAAVTTQIGEIGSAVSSVGDLAGHSFQIMSTGAVNATTKTKELEVVLANVAKHTEKMQRIKDTMDAAAAEATAQKKYVEDLKALWRDGAGSIAADFVKSMSRGFEEVYNLAVKMMKRMEEEAKRLNKEAGGFGYGALKYGAAAIGGGLAGYGAGSAVGANGGSAGQALLGGAAAGAMAGSAFGPWGALAGGIAGATLGLIGFGKASAEAAKQMAEAQKVLAANIAGVRAQVAGDTLGAAIAQEKARFDALRKQTEDAYSGGGAGSEQVAKRNAILAQLNSLEAQRIQQLRDESALVLKQLNEDVQVQILRNNGHVEEADALAKAQDQERRFAELRKQGIDDATLELLRQSEAQRDVDDARRQANDEALKAAEALKQAGEEAARAAQEAADKARAQRQAVEDIQVELLNAQGNTGAAGDLQFQLEQQRRLDDAKKNQSDDYVQKLLELQQIQRDQRAAQQLIDSTGSGGGSRSSGAAQALSAVSSVVTDRTALMLVDLTRAEVSLLSKIEVNTRSGGSGGGGIHATFNFSKKISEEDFEEITDRIETLLDEGLGSRRTRQTIFSGKVGR